MKTKFWVLLFTALYMGAASIFAVVQGNVEFVFYIVVMLILAGMVWLVHRRVGLSAGALWCLTVWGFFHMAGGLVPVPESWPINGDIRVLYSWWLIPDLLKYDQITHAFGFGVTTWVCWQGLGAAISGRSNQPPRPTWGLLVLCGAAGMGFGALNEIVEFVATLTMPKTNVGGYVNTGWDLVSNFVGCVVAVVWIRLSGLKSDGDH